MKKYIVIVLILSLGLSSCFVSRVDVGDNGNNFARAQNKGYVTYSRTKNVYLFWGLWPISNQQPPTPPGCDYTIETSTGILDGILFFFTDGIFGMRTVKILVKAK